MKKFIFALLVLLFTVGIAFTAEAKDFDVTLRWDANSEPDIAGYNVYRADTAGGPYTSLRNGENLIPHPTTTYTDTFSVPDGTIKTFYYVVTAVDTSQLESDYSNEVNEAFDGNVAPDAPTNFEITIQVKVAIRVDSLGNTTIAMTEVETR